MPVLAERPTSNTPEMSVGELSGALKRTIEDRFGFVRVRGEISNFRGVHTSGHAYFCLKDETARIDAVVWKGTFAKLKTKPQEGLEVIATGKITTFPGKSSYQIVIEAIEPAGIGALMALLEARRKALGAEGLFDEGRKTRLPYLPTLIGVVTSPTGAVIRDILHRIADRFPRHVVVWPVRVQGDTAAAEVAAAIHGFNALPAAGRLRRPDVMIVARGGGSLEDLWAFNEEIVVRAAAASTIPLISAIGHETDWTLIDHVADLRAPTPSGAAEKVVPVRSDLIASHLDLGRRHRAATFRLLERQRGDWRALCRVLTQGDTITAIPRQRLDRVDTRLAGAMASDRDRNRLALARLANRLAQQAPRTRLARADQHLKALEQRMRHCLDVAEERRVRRLAQGGQRLRTALLGIGRDQARGRTRLDQLAGTMVRVWSASLQRRHDSVERCGKLLNTLGYKQVLSRGFALVRDAEGRPRRSALDIAAPAALDIEFADGHISVITSEGAPPATKRPRAPRKVEQASLF
jgi:exodeoxyribonuclease VII large subunit